MQSPSATASTAQDEAESFGEQNVSLNLLHSQFEPSAAHQSERHGDKQPEKPVVYDPVEYSDGESFGYPKTHRDLAHWSLFGRRGFLQSQKSIKFSWKQCEPFNTPCNIAWELQIPPESLCKMFHGFTPKEMEDKWFIYTDGPDAAGAATVNFHRSWTGQKVASLAVRVFWGKDSAAELWHGRIVGLTLEGESTSVPEEDTAEEMAKFEVLEACDWVLGVRLVDDIKEPKSWEALSKRPVVSRQLSTPRTAYKGTTVTKETMEDFLRVGDKAQIFLS